MLNHFDDVVIVATGIAALLVSIGVIYRYVIRPIRMIGSTLHDHWEYLNDQLTNGKHAGTLREQVNRIENKQTVGAEAFRHLAGEVQELRNQQGQQAHAIAALQASMRTVAATTASTAVTVDAVQEAVTHDGYTTDEHPITP